MRLPQIAEASPRASLHTVQYPPSFSSVTWFAGAEVLGIVAPGKTLEWTAPSGRHELRAVDDRGHVARVSVTVHWPEEWVPLA